MTYFNKAREFVIDSFSKGIIEPLKIKVQAVKSATEVANMILRIDDIIAAGGKDQKPQYPGMNPEMM